MYLPTYPCRYLSLGRLLECFPAWPNVPTYPWRYYLREGFWNGLLLGQTCEIPATARGNHFRTVVCLDSLDSLDSLDMFICCTGIRLLVEEQKMAGTVLADVILPEIRLSVTTVVSSGENFYLPICRSLHLLGAFVLRCWARQYLAHAFSELNQKNSPHACKSLENARTFSVRDFAASCDTTCKSHFMCASGDGKRSKHAKHKLNYFTSCDPTMTFFDLLRANLLAFYLAYLLAFDFYLAYLLAFYLAYLLAYYLAFYLAYLLAYLLISYLAFYLVNLLAFYLANILALYLANLLAFYLTFYNPHLAGGEKTMHCWGECKGKGTANHFKTELNPQVPPVRNVLTMYWDQETNWTVNLSTLLPCICI